MLYKSTNRRGILELFVQLIMIRGTCGSKPNDDGPRNYTNAHKAISTSGFEREVRNYYDEILCGWYLTPEALSARLIPFSAGFDEGFD